MLDESMKTQDNTVYDGIPTKGATIGKIPNNELVTMHSGALDPLASRVRQATPAEEAAHLAATKAAKAARLHVVSPSPSSGESMTGTADPLFAHGFQVKDKVYHKVRKKEGKIDDLAASSGKIHVAFEDGSTAWCQGANLVKL